MYSLDNETTIEPQEMRLILLHAKSQRERSIDKTSGVALTQAKYQLSSKAFISASP